ncbi:biotin--protein ligase-like isoform X2 [Pomacea canaliculata]|nr:biotin--protein ligase-like isoform X2 [Pomacea canaliculata]
MVGRVVVYNGEGACEKSFNLLKKSLENCLCPEAHPVSCITPEDIKKGGLSHDCAAVVFGGGYDKGFIHALGSEGIQEIRSFVLGGGKYFGFCAGGYFGCDYIEFDKGGPLEVCGKRDLCFYPGKCIGPVVPHFEYDTHRGADAVPIRVHDIPQLTSGFTCKLYVNGGGKFMPYHDSSGCKIDIIASYCNLPNQPAAIIKSEIGAKGGRAILTGCHPEF